MGRRVRLRITYGTRASTFIDCFFDADARVVHHDAGDTNKQEEDERDCDLHEECLHFVLVVVVVVEVAHVPLPVVARENVRRRHSTLAAFTILVPLHFFLHNLVLADFLLQKCFVFGFLVMSCHPCLVHCALNIDLIGTKSLMMRHDQVNITCLSYVHVHLIVK